MSLMDLLSTAWEAVVLAMMVVMLKGLSPGHFECLRDQYVRQANRAHARQPRPEN